MHVRLYFVVIVIVVSICLSCGVFFNRNEDKSTAAMERAIKASRTITPPYDGTIVRAMRVADSVRVSQTFDSLEVVLHRVSEDDSLFFFTYWPRQTEDIAGGNRTFAVHRGTIRFAWGLIRAANANPDMIFEK